MFWVVGVLFPGGMGSGLSVFVRACGLLYVGRDRMGWDACDAMRCDVMSLRGTGCVFTLFDSFGVSLRVQGCWCIV